MKLAIAITTTLLFTNMACEHAQQSAPNSKEQRLLPIAQSKDVALNEGDIIFQSSLSGQSQAIQLATHSKYSHCGIVFKKSAQFYVLEAIQPVQTTPLNKWIARGDQEHYVVKRLNNADKVINKDVLQNMHQEAKKFMGKNYDLAFGWSDEDIYCSELVWKIYQRTTGIEIGHLQKLGDFDLTNKEVKKKLKERYHDNIPINELVISPGAIFESNLLVTVVAN